MKNFSDEAFILRRDKENYIGISKNFGKVIFSGNGIEKKFPALNGGFLIKYNFEKLYNHLKKIILYPQNVYLENILDYKDAPGIFQLIIFFCDQFSLFGIKCEKTWNFINKLKKNEYNNFELFNLSLNIFESLNGEFSINVFNKNLEKKEFINNFKDLFYSEKQFKIFEKLIIYIFDKELVLKEFIK